MVDRRAETIRWNVAGAAFVDAIEFERLASDSATQAAAVDLYAGDLLEESTTTGSSPNASACARSICKRSTTSSPRIVPRATTWRRLDTRAGFWPSNLGVKTWSAKPWRSIMRRRFVRCASGVRQFAKRLRAEMGIEPMPETLALREAILRGEALIGSVDAGVSVRADGRQLRVLPFIGRERERAAMRARWDAAAGGAGGVVLVSGKPASARRGWSASSHSKPKRRAPACTAGARRRRNLRRTKVSSKRCARRCR